MLGCQHCPVIYNVGCRLKLIMSPFMQFGWLHKSLCLLPFRDSLKWFTSLRCLVVKVLWHSTFRLYGEVQRLNNNAQVNDLDIGLKSWQKFPVSGYCWCHCGSLLVGEMYVFVFCRRVRWGLAAQTITFITWSILRVPIWDSKKYFRNNKIMPFFFAVFDPLWTSALARPAEYYR